MGTPRPALAAFLLALCALAGCSPAGRLLRGYAEAEPTGAEILDDLTRTGAPRALRGQARFVFDDFGSLNTDVLETYAMPWKMVAAALVRDRQRSVGAPPSRATLDRALAEYGFLRPRRIANWQGPAPRLERPLGIVAGTARRGFPAVEIEIANLGCAACHAGPLFGHDGRPTGDAWLGLPNPSLDLSAYADDVLAALRRELATPDSLLRTMTLLFPDMSEREVRTIRKHLIPRARERLEERARVQGGLLPFENGGPGLMNGVGSLRFLVGMVHEDARTTQIAWTSPPGLEGTTLRHTLTVDGVYAAPGSPRAGPLARVDVSDRHLDGLAGVASLFIVGTQGVDPARARRAIPRVAEVMSYLHDVRSPPFPGPVDTVLALRGAAVYAQDCASCHGRYSPGVRDVRLLEHPNRLVPQDRMGTDPVRWRTADSASLAAIRDIGYGSHIETLNGGGYVAPDLSGVWATAPYLHNGSVPTLWHVLNADERPARFQVGGHALDYDLVGLAGRLDEQGRWMYPEGYEPWSRPFLYDTREPGRSNAGHEFRTLTPAQRRALLEYMKVL